MFLRTFKQIFISRSTTTSCLPMHMYIVHTYILLAHIDFPFSIQWRCDQVMRTGKITYERLKKQTINKNRKTLRLQSNKIIEIDRESFGRQFYNSFLRFFEESSNYICHHNNRTLFVGRLLEFVNVLSIYFHSSIARHCVDCRLSIPGYKLFYFTI